MSRLSDYTALSDLENYKTIERPLFVVSAEDTVNRSGKNQVNLVVKDGKTSPKVTIFDTTKAQLAERYSFFGEGKAVVMTVTKKEPYYNASTEMKEAADIELSDFATVVTANPQKSIDYILEKVREAAKSHENGGFDSLSRLVEDIYSEYREEMLHGSGAVAYHHSGIGGNVRHTEEVVELCSSLLDSSIGKDVDAELLLCGAALHDIGKLVCYDTDNFGITKITREGLARGGHHLDSLRILYEAEKNGNYNPERLLILENMIASHHGSREYGDPATPITVEGFWLHAMDDLSAKHDMVMKEIKRLNPGEFSAKTVFGLDTRLYRREDQ